MGLSVSLSLSLCRIFNRIATMTLNDIIAKVILDTLIVMSSCLQWAG
jgi:hypothetical protein